MNEQPLFFHGRNHTLFGVLHRPDRTGEDLGFVFCSPYFEEKLWGHRVYVNFARELAAIGIPVLRFDYMGHGDSEGEFEDATLETRIENVFDAVQCLRERTAVGRIGLLGLRFGATTAAVAAERRPGDVQTLVLWEPLTAGSAYMQEMLRINLASQMASYKEIRTNRKEMAATLQAGGRVNVDGYGLTGEVFRQAGAIELLDGDKAFQGPTLVVQISRNVGMVNPKLKELASRYAGGCCRSVAEEPFWKEIKKYVPASPDLFAKTVQWLEDQL